MSKQDEELKGRIESFLSTQEFTPAKEIIDEFDLLSIDENTTQIEREVAKKVTDRIEKFTQILEELLQPESNITKITECGFFSEEEIQKEKKTYRKLMRLIRSYNSAELEATKRAYVDFLTLALPSWKKAKESLRRVLKRLEDGWSKDESSKKESGYFG